MTSIYRHIIRDAFTISWNKRWLWLFGLFATLLGSGGEYNLVVKNISSIQDQGAFLTNLSILVQESGIGVWLETFREVVQNVTLSSLVLLFLIIIIALLLLWITHVSQGSLIFGIFRTFNNESTSLTSSWQQGKKLFLSVFGVNILGKIFFYVVFFIISAPFFFIFLKTHVLGWQWVLIIISFLVFVPFAIVVSFLIKYAVIFVVTKKRTVRQSIHEGWQLFIKNWIVSLELALIIFAINILAGLALIVGLVFIALPFFVVGFIGIYFQLNTLLWFALVAGAFLLIVVMFTFGAFLTTFQTAAWVALFIRLTEGVVIPKIIRLAAGFPSRLKQKQAT